MKHNLRILGVVACLLVVWMVTRGTNGCMVAPDTAVLELEGDKNKHGEADVFGSGKKGKLTDVGNDKVKGNVAITWFSSIQGDKYSGVLTVMTKKFNSSTNKWEYDGKHAHVPFEVTTAEPQPPALTIPDPS